MNRKRWPHLQSSSIDYLLDNSLTNGSDALFRLLALITAGEVVVDELLHLVSRFYPLQEGKEDAEQCLLAENIPRSLVIHIWEKGLTLPDSWTSLRKCLSR